MKLYVDHEHRTLKYPCKGERNRIKQEILLPVIA